MRTTNFNNPNHLNLEQMEELQQFGPFDTSDASYIVLYREDDDGYHEYSCLDKRDTMTEYIVSLVKKQENVQTYDAYSLNDLLAKLPKNIQVDHFVYGLMIDMEQHVIWYDHNSVLKRVPLHDEYTNSDNIIAAVYKMFIWMLKNYPGKIKNLNE